MKTEFGEVVAVNNTGGFTYLSYRTDKQKARGTSATFAVGVADSDLDSARLGLVAAAAGQRIEVVYDGLNGTKLQALKIAGLPVLAC